MKKIMNAIDKVLNFLTDEWTLYYCCFILAALSLIADDRAAMRDWIIMGVLFRVVIYLIEIRNEVRKKRTRYINYDEGGIVISHG